MEANENGFNAFMGEDLGEQRRPASSLRSRTLRSCETKFPISTIVLKCFYLF